MIKISQLKLPYNHDEAALKKKIQKKLKLSDGQNFTYKIQKKSLDARKKPELFFVYSVLVELLDEERIVKKLHLPEVSIAKEPEYHYPVPGTEVLKERPLIIGAGPAGLFCAYILAECGYAPIVLEQ